MTGPPEQSLGRDVAEDFLYQEAKLLDAWELDKWLGLFTRSTPLTYWVPGADGDVDPSRRTSILYDDRHRLEDRVWRLLNGSAHAQVPRSITTHIISNVSVARADGNEILICSNFLVHEVRKDEQRSFAGQLEHSLTWEESEWRIAKKTVLLTNRNAPIFNLSFII